MLADVRACTRGDAPNFHGKEGVDGSSPSEGFTKGQQMGFLVASGGATRRGRAREPVPKICPQAHERREVLA